MMIINFNDEMKYEFCNNFSQSGFDPCGRNYLFFEDSIKLDEEDAVFVEVLHTDDNGMGTSTRSGDVDIYFNGGVNQPESYPRPAVVDQSSQTAQLFFGGTHHLTIRV